MKPPSIGTSRIDFENEIHGTDVVGDAAAGVDFCFAVVLGGGGPSVTQSFQRPRFVTHSHSVTQ